MSGVGQLPLVPALDERLSGGARPGDLVVVTADPDSPAELLGLVLARQRPTRYLSTLRPAAAVERAADRLGVDPDVRAVDGDDLLAAPAEHLSGLDSGAAVVIDPTTTLERAERTHYVDFLDTLAGHLRTTGSVGLLHCPRMDPRAMRRDLTLARADAVWDVRLGIEAGNARATITVRKDRSGIAPLGPVSVSFDAERGVVVE